MLFRSRHVHIVARLAALHRHGRPRRAVRGIVQADVTSRIHGLILERDAIDAIRVGDVMSYEITTVNENDELWGTLERMRTLGVRRMPVVDATGLLVGIITLDDLVELMAEAMGHIASLIRRELNTEARRRS